MAVPVGVVPLRGVVVKRVVFVRDAITVAVLPACCIVGEPVAFRPVRVVAMSVAVRVVPLTSVVGESVDVASIPVPIWVGPLLWVVWEGITVGAVDVITKPVAVGIFTLTGIVGEGVVFVRDTVAVAVLPSRRVVREPVALRSVRIVAVPISVGVVPLCGVSWEGIDEGSPCGLVVPVSVKVPVAPLGRFGREIIAVIGPTVAISVRTAESISGARTHHRWTRVALETNQGIPKPIAVGVVPL